MTHMMASTVIFFFFSSRRRHTRFDCDWSSDVCSSDLLEETRRITRKRGVDVVIDSVGQETWDKSLRALARGGRLVTCGRSEERRVGKECRSRWSPYH